MKPNYAIGFHFFETQKPNYVIENKYFQNTKQI